MRLRTPQQPDERGIHEGRPYWLWLPTSEPPWPAMVILHGAGSAKENHADFARLCAASGWAALSYDQRGHGESEDLMAPAAVNDVGRMAAMLAAREEIEGGHVCVRGSSMGGFLAIHAAAVSDAIAGVIAICPATEDGPAARPAQRRARDAGRPRRARCLARRTRPHGGRDRCWPASR